MNSTISIAAPAKRNPLGAISNAYQLLLNSWLMIPAFLFYHVVSGSLVNIPIMDDYDIPLDFVLKFSKADFWQKWVLLFSQHEEHRLVPSKLLYLGYYYLTGGINFRVLGLIGDLQLLLVAFVGVHFIKRLMPDSWKVPAIIWMLVVFDLNTYENAAICMYAVANYGVCCYFFAALYFYDKGDKWIPVAVLFQFFCAFSNANGLAADILIIVFNIARSPRKRITSLIAGCVFTGLYFIHYQPVNLPNKIPFDIKIPVTFFIRQSGAHFSFANSAVIGLLVLVLVAVKFPWRRLSDMTFTPILCVFLFAISTMLLSAVFRSCYKDAQFQTSRYLIYPQMMIGCLCLFIWMKLKTQFKRRIGGTAMICVMLFAYSGNYRFGKLAFERTCIRANTMKFWHPDKASCVPITKEACEEGIYCIEDNR